MPDLPREPKWGKIEETNETKSRGKFMSAIYQLWIWGVVMVIWKFSSVFPLSISRCLSNFVVSGGDLQFFTPPPPASENARRRGVSQCCKVKISARPEIIRQKPASQPAKQQQHSTVSLFREIKITFSNWIITVLSFAHNDAVKLWLSICWWCW